MAKISKDTRINYPLILVTASTVGLVASFWQAVERIQMLKNPSAILSCNLSPVVDCSGVLNNKLAAVFGPPNAFIGMVVFSMLLAFGIQRIGGGSWSNLTRKVVVILSKIIMLFSLWFFAVSLYSIGKICIFCVFIWASSMPIGIYGVKDYLGSQAKLPSYQKVAKNFLEKHHLTLLIFIYATLITLFLLKFRGYYFG
jgi:uncharacterized membrane protein